MFFGKTIKSHVIAIIAIALMSTFLQYGFNREINFFLTFLGTGIGLAIGAFTFSYIDEKIKETKQKEKDVE